MDRIRKRGEMGKGQREKEWQLLRSPFSLPPFPLLPRVLSCPSLFHSFFIKQLFHRRVEFLLNALAEADADVADAAMLVNQNGGRD